MIIANTIFARPKKKYARPKEFTDRYHNPGAIVGSIRERWKSLEVPKVLIFIFCSISYWPPEEMRKTAFDGEVIFVYWIFKSPEQNRFLNAYFEYIYVQELELLVIYFLFCIAIEEQGLGLCILQNFIRNSVMGQFILSQFERLEHVLSSGMEAVYCFRFFFFYSCTWKYILQYFLHSMLQQLLYKTWSELYT